MLFIQIAVTVVLILLVGMAVLISVQTTEIKKISEATAKVASETIDWELARMRGEKGGEESASAISALADGKDMAIELVPITGESTVYFTDEKWQPLTQRSNGTGLFEKLAQIHAGGNSFIGHLDRALLGFDTKTRIALITEKNAPVEFVLIRYDISEVKASLESITLIVLLIVLFGVLAAVLTTYWFTGSIVRPFRQVNEIVQQYSKGEYNVRIPISDTQEATQLALSFNAMADQLNDLENTRRSFVANVSHELRSPLTSMRGFLEAMQDGTIEPSERDQYIDIVLSETKRMTTMVNDLLDLARIESGKTALNLEIFDINELIRRTLITFEARISEQKMDVDIRFATEQCFVEADSAQISQVLRNLIDNAIKYSGGSTQIRLSTYTLRREVFVTVQDFGRGIPEEDTPHIFDRFYKVEKAHTPREGGTGLGLSIVKKIIDQHGQRISVKSALGKGTTFTFTLRRASNPRAAAATAARKQERSGETEQA